MANGKSPNDELSDIGAYKTSDQVERHFCNKCGATVSYYHNGMDTIDIAPGLFEAPEGSRAGNWLQWNQDGDDLGYKEDAVDKEFAKKLANGVGQNTRRAAH